MAGPVSRRRVLVASAVMAGLAAAPTWARGGAARAVAWQRLGRLDRGFNIPDWAGRGPAGAPSDSVLGKLRKLGFSAVRLPIDPSLLAGTGNAQIVDWVVEAAQALHGHGYSVTLDMHPGGDLVALFGSDPQKAGGLVEAAWDTLALQAAALPAESTFLELLNEPPLDPSGWLALRDRLLGVVRGHCPDHTIIWGVARYQALWEMAGARAMADANTILAVHNYEPMSFTHQCADWAGPALKDLAGVPFPAGPDSPMLLALVSRLEAANDEPALDLLNRDYAEAWTPQRIAASFAPLADWTQAQDCPFVLNEFGVYKNCAPKPDRLAWIAAVAAAARGAGGAWTYWAFDGGFGFVGDRRDPDSIDLDMVTALVGRAPA